MRSPEKVGTGRHLEGGEIDLCCLPEWFPAGGPLFFGFHWKHPMYGEWENIGILSGKLTVCELENQHFIAG